MSYLSDVVGGPSLPEEPPQYKSYYPEPDFDTYEAETEDPEDIALYIPLTFTGSITVTVEPATV